MSEEASCGRENSHESTTLSAGEKKPSAPVSSRSASDSRIQANFLPEMMKVYENMVGHSAYAATANSGDWNGQQTASSAVPLIPSNLEEAMKYVAGPAAVHQGDQPTASRSKGAGARPSSLRNLRKRSSTSTTTQTPAQDSAATRGPKSRRKSKETDGRWSKRFTWPENLHRDFVSAIFDVGLKHSSPSAILEYMPEHEQINSERVKSHLQKYRLNRAKAKKEFMSSYDASMARMQREGLPQGGSSLAHGEVAAHVAYETIHMNQAQAVDTPNPEETSSDDAKPIASTDRDEQPVQRQQDHHDTILIPKLTEEEKKTLIGASVGHVMALFLTLTKQLTLQREATKAARQAESQKAGNMMDEIQNSFGVPAASYDIGTEPNDTKADTNVAAPSNAPASRVNIKESTMMKREMKHQMAFQNKMRMLKQQEEQKLGSKSADSAAPDTGQAIEVGDKSQATPVESAQGAGEHEGEQRQRGMSMTEDFWYTDVVDDQLFEFLMNN